MLGVFAWFWVYLICGSEKMLGKCGELSLLSDHDAMDFLNSQLEPYTKDVMFAIKILPFVDDYGNVLIFETIHHGRVGFSSVLKMTMV